MVLRVRPTPTRFPTNSLYTLVDKHTLAFYIKCVPPMGWTNVVAVGTIIVRSMVQFVLINSRSYRTLGPFLKDNPE